MPWPAGLDLATIGLERRFLGGQLVSAGPQRSRSSLPLPQGAGAIVARVRGW